VEPTNLYNEYLQLCQQYSINSFMKTSKPKQNQDIVDKNGFRNFFFHTNSIEK